MSITVLELKGIQYAYKAVNLLNKEQGSEEFCKVNPYEKVPAFKDGENVLVESLAIIEYLEEKYPEKFSIFPNDPSQKAMVRAIALQIACGIQPIQNLSVLKVVRELDDDKEAAANWAKKFIEDGFTKLEKMLEKTSGIYCFGDSLTLADVCLVPQVYNAKRFGVDLEKYPLIKRIDAKLATVEAIEKSHPNNQPDAPNE